MPHPEQGCGRRERAICDGASLGEPDEHEVDAILDEESDLDYRFGAVEIPP